MAVPKPHRKRVKHFELIGEIHELTFSCYHRLPILDDDWRRQQLTISINRAILNQGWRLTAFVYMPEHVHLLVFPSRNGLKVADLLFGIKRPFSFRVKQRLIKTCDPLLDELTIRQRPNVSTFRFWQEGPGYDRNIQSETVLMASIDYIHLNPVRRGLADRTSVYRWSSAQWYETDGNESLPSLPQLTPVPADWFTGSADVTRY